MTSNYDQPDERDRVNTLCKQIFNWQQSNSNYEVSEYFTKKETEGLWHVVRLENGKDKTYFGFLKLETGFALGDVD
jgi:hypothetical protein